MPLIDAPDDLPPPRLERLRRLVARLRAPDGCPWDREQTLGDLRAYLLEEAHEVAAAIDSGDAVELAGELGDLLFQAVFIGRLAEEAGSFTLAEVIDRVVDKMVDRHPHVFGTPASRADPDGTESPTDAAAVARAWERRKARQRSAGSLLSGVATSLPALIGAYRLTQKAAGIGFDWPDAAAVAAKVREELVEVEDAAAQPGDREAVAEELGDLLFAVANLARHHGVDPEAALASANLKFRRRFAQVEQRLAAAGRELAEVDLETMDAAWEEVKRAERDGETK